MNAPELGPVADTVSLYEAVERLRPAPIGRAALFRLGVPALLPPPLVFAIGVPIKDILIGLLRGVA